MTGEENKKGQRLKNEIFFKSDDRLVSPEGPRGICAP